LEGWRGRVKVHYSPPRLGEKGKQAYVEREGHNGGWFSCGSVKVGPGKSILDEAGAEEKSSDRYVKGKARKRRDDGLECGISLLFWTIFKVGNRRLGLSSPAPRAGAPFQRRYVTSQGRNPIDGLKKIFYQ
jgi:hypothetical protein